MTDLPELFLRHRSSLQTWTLADQPAVSYSSAAWARCFSVDPDFQDLDACFSGAVSRADVFRLSVECRNEPSALGIRRLFLASMLWGFGRVGYGAYRTSRMLAASRCNYVLQKGYEHLLAGRLQSAYNSMWLDCCGPAFFTKFFYFAGLAGVLTPPPLILDSRVANSLEHLSGAGFLKVTRGRNGQVSAILRDAAAYQTYLQTLVEWAGVLSCRPDSLEYFLFSWNGIEPN